MIFVMPPILQNLGWQIQLYEPERIGERGWKYKAYSIAGYMVSFGAPRNLPPVPSLLFI